jgi:hypothetical protein
LYTTTPTHFFDCADVIASFSIDGDKEINPDQLAQALSIDDEDAVTMYCRDASGVLPQLPENKKIQCRLRKHGASDHSYMLRVFVDGHSASPHIDIVTAGEFRVRVSVVAEGRAGLLRIVSKQGTEVKLIPDEEYNVTFPDSPTSTQVQRTASW